MKDAAQCLSEAAQLYQERRKVYKRSDLNLGNVLEALFPNGVTIESNHDHIRFSLIVQIVTKLTRYANNWQGGHKDSIRDAMVYCAMLEAQDESGHL